MRATLTKFLNLLKGQSWQDVYLNQSQDHVDLERRMKNVEYMEQSIAHNTLSHFRI